MPRWKFGFPFLREPRWCSTKFKLSLGLTASRRSSAGNSILRSAEIARQVGGLVARHLPSVWAEHVGSTAVPGCGGRGIIDLLIACPEGG